MSELTSFLRKTAGRALSFHPAMARATARIAIDERIIPYLFADPRLPLRLNADQSLMRDFMALVGDDRLLGAILDDPLLSERIYLSEPARRQLQTNPRVQRFLLTDSQVVDVISKNRDIAARLASNAQWREWLLDEESFKTWAAGNEAIFRLIFEHNGVVEKIVRADHLLSRLICHPACFESFLADESIVERMLDDPRVMDRWLARPDWPALARTELLKRLGADPAIVDEILNDERVIERCYASKPIRRLIEADHKLFLELASSDEGLAAILADKQLLERIMTSGIDEIIHNEKLLGPVLASAPAFERLVADGELVLKLLWNEKVLGRLLANESLLFKVLSNERAWTRIIGDDQFLTRLISNERVWGKIIADEVLLTKLVTNGRTLEKILSDDQLLMRVISHERVFGKILADDVLLTKLVSNGRALEKILSDDQLLMRIIPHKRVLGKILADDVLLTKLVSNGRALEKILSDDQLLNHVLSNERAFGKILANDALLAKFIANGRGLEKIVADGSLFGKLLSSNRAIDHILGNPELFEKLLANDRAVKSMMADESISARILAQPKLIGLIRQNGKLMGRIVLNEGAVRNLMADPAIIESKSIDALMEAHAEFRRIWRALEPCIDKARPGLAERLHESMLALKKTEDIPERLLDVICEDNKVFLAGGALAFTDRFSLWTELNEILIDEDYYFETDAAEPRILDCGSNFGMAIYYFKKLHPASKIIAFEPVPSLQALIESNVRENRMSGVEIVPCALAAEPGESVFYESMSYPMAGSLTGRRRGFGDKLHEIRVDCRPLSRFLDEPVQFLKLDIEGSEDAVLAEAAGKLGAVENMFIEYHHGAGMPDGRLEAIFRILDGAGFDWQVGKSFHFGRQTRRRALTYSGRPFSLNIWAKKKPMQG
ncbi:FkbM family methyltransferase [bacterium]|nr:FkbM family methyltransferase [bacterium]